MQPARCTQRTFTLTLNTGYCNWNKVQRDYDLTPFWPVTLPLLHALSPFFCIFFHSLAFFLSEVGPIPRTTRTKMKGKKNTQKTTTHNKTQQLFCLLSLVFLPPHLVSKYSTGGVVKKSTCTFSLLQFHVNRFQTCLSLLNKKTRNLAWVGLSSAFI